jgi:tetratricopeptide (TPR) repeat protein
MACAGGTRTSDGPYANRVRLAGDIQKSVVTIVTYDMDNRPSGIGTGFFVEGPQPWHLITNYHVLQGAFRAVAKTHDGKEYPIEEVVAQNEAVDLARVRVGHRGRTYPGIKLSGRLPSVAEPVLVVGSPLGLEHTVSEGIVSAVREIPSVGDIFQLSAPISPGSSGSPVVDVHGRVVGVVSFQALIGQNLNFAVAGQNVLDLRPLPVPVPIAYWAFNNSRDRTRVAGELCKKGFEFSAQGEYTKALEYFKDAATENPEQASAWYGLGSCYIGLEQPEQAIDAFKQAIRSSENKAQAYFHIGYYYFSLERHDDALAAYEQALSIDPDFGPAYHGLGLLYSAMGRLQDEQEAFAQVIRLQPDRAASHFNIGLTYGKMGRYQDAIAAHQRALAIDPGLAPAHYNIGVMYGQLRQPESALDAFKAALRIDPDYAPAHYQLGLFFLSRRQKEDALAQYKILKQLDEEQADALFNQIYE